MTKIGWVARAGTKPETWNPFVGCSIVSPGCTNCYAMGVAAWIDGMNQTDRYAGTTKVVNGRPFWTGVVKRSAPRIFEAPLRWAAPRTIFANSMSDLFHEALTPDDLWDVFAIMAASPRHTFQILTKRAARMRAALSIDSGLAVQRMHHALKRLDFTGEVALTWPLPNVWLGISAEDQPRLVERWPFLRDTPAAIRFISYEPALGPLDMVTPGVVGLVHHHPDNRVATGSPENRAAMAQLIRSARRKMGDATIYADWVIVGGESGNRARPFDLSWARSVVSQCLNSGTAVFVKQMGSQPVTKLPAGPVSIEALGELARITDRKGENIDEWPDDLKVRDWPA